MEISTIAVIGAGTMGRGIAQTFASKGYPVMLIDVHQGALDDALTGIKQSLAKFVQKGKITAEDQQVILRRIKPATALAPAAEVHLAVEAVSEQMPGKTKVFQVLDRICRPDAILASNTSSISITALGGLTKRPAQVAGMHFMNPVPLMSLVEVIRGLATSDETMEAVTATAAALGKTPVEARDFPGFISNRILMPMINEAVFALMEGVGTRDAIDTVMKLGMNHPMGPLEVIDFIGLDTELAIDQVMYEETKDPKYAPPTLLRKMVAAGRLGRKSGRGFYDYDR